MYNNQIVTGNNDTAVNGEFKVIEVNVSDPGENLYAVCTPIKMD